MKAMILAAGKGTRLGKITESVPKALVQINGKSALQIAVEKCTLAGFAEIIVNVHHFAEKVEAEVDKLNSAGFHISVSDERIQLLETGGGLYKARKFFDNEPFLLYNTDIITDINLNELLKFHFSQNGLATLAVRSRSGNRYLLTDTDGRLCGWINKASGEKIVTCEDNVQLCEIAFSGIHIIDPEIFSFMNDGVYSMTAVYLQLAAKHKIFTFRHDSGYWFDIGTPENLNKIREFFLGGGPGV